MSQKKFSIDIHFVVIAENENQAINHLDRFINEVLKIDPLKNRVEEYSEITKEYSLGDAIFKVLDK